MVHLDTMYYYERVAETEAMRARGARRAWEREQLRNAAPATPQPDSSRRRRSRLSMPRAIRRQANPLS